MMGQWALYHDGWLLSTKVNRAPWQAFQAANEDPLNNQVFQLYNLNENFNQSEDIAAEHPEKVKEMRAMFLEEAKKYQVLPLNASVAARVAAPRPSLTAGRNELVYTRPMTGLPQGDAPYLLNTSYTITADITVPEGGAEGMIVTSGGRFAGWGFYLLDGKPVFNWNLLNLEWVRWEGPDALTPGQHTVEFDFEYDGWASAPSPTTASPASARAAWARSRWMARWSPRSAWRRPSRSSCNGMRASTSAPTPSPASTTPTTCRRSR
jgi:hypothetical protein